MAKVTGRFDTLTLFWANRILVHADGVTRLFAEDRLQDRRLLLGLGLTSDVIAAPSRTKVEAILRRRLRAHKVIVDALRGRTPFDRNITWLGENVGLSDLEAQVLAFVAAGNLSELLNRTLDLFGPLRVADVHDLLAAALDTPRDRIAKILRPSERLMRSGLLWVSGESPWRWETKIGLLLGLTEQLPLAHDNPADLLRSNFRPAAPSSLKLEAFAHLNAELGVLRAVLEEATGFPRRGVNVLLWGPAGTGKTTLTRAMACELGLAAYEVAHQDRFGNPLKGESRLRAMALAQAVIGGKGRNFLVVDEAEDIFVAGEDFGADSHRQTGRVTKAHMNAVLEENPVPTVWITNSLNGLDPAYLRRFDQIIQVPVPPRQVRAAILQEVAGDLDLSGTWISKVSELELSPGILTRTASVGARIVAEDLSQNPTQVIETLLNGHLAALGKRTLRATPQVSRDVPFQPGLVNSDANLPAILEGLRQTGSGRVLCYGQPGTGKSAFGRYVADATGRPLLVRRASDLLGKYVGETEQALAAAFNRAAREGAVLQLDEIDSLLGSRDRAQHGWEVTQTNELLTQLETFDGMLVATTNRLDAQDEASLRRFDLKVHFQTPTREQRRALLETYLTVLEVPCTPTACRRVEVMAGLTQGDFALVLRQGLLNPIASAGDFVERLARELELKPEQKRRVVGFGSLS